MNPDVLLKLHELRQQLAVARDALEYAEGVASGSRHFDPTEAHRLRHAALKAIGQEGGRHAPRID